MKRKQFLLIEMTAVTNLVLLWRAYWTTTNLHTVHYLISLTVYFLLL